MYNKHRGSRCLPFQLIDKKSATHFLVEMRFKYIYIWTLSVSFGRPRSVAHRGVCIIFMDKCACDQLLYYYFCQTNLVSSFAHTISTSSNSNIMPPKNIQSELHNLHHTRIINIICKGKTCAVFYYFLFLLWPDNAAIIIL